MKVLIVTSFLDRPEANLYRGLQDNGVTIEVLGDEKTPFLEILKEGGIPFSSISLKSRFDLKGIKAIRRKLLGGNYDLIHAFSSRALSNSIVASFGHKLPLVTYRGTVGHLSVYDPAAWMTFLNPKVSRIICVSEAVRQYLLSLGIAPEKTVTIYKGHDIRWYQGASSVSRAEFGISDNDYVVGCAANMRPVKGVHVLIESLKYLEDIQNLKLLLIGEVRDARLHTTENNSDGKIVFTGFRKDATEIMRLCDTFVMPSLAREGLPKATIEAMSQGIPAIVTSVGGLPELVTDRVSGLVVPPSDPKNLAAAIRELASNIDLRRSLGKGGKERIIESFNIETTVTRTRDVYEAVSLKHTNREKRLQFIE